MNKEYTWARNMIKALDFYCKYLMTVCNKPPRKPEAKATLQQLIDENLTGYIKEDLQQKKKQGGQKKMRSEYLEEEGEN